MTTITKHKSLPHWWYECNCVCIWKTTCLSSHKITPLTCRSQRDIAGEKERRAKDLADLQGKLTQLGSEIATAENDKRQFDAAVKAELESLAEQRSVIIMLKTC